MALLMVSHKEYNKTQAITNAIRYVTRTRVNENRRGELLSYGVKGVSFCPQDAIEQFKIVQKKFREYGYIGKRIFHETLHLSEEDLTLLNYDPKHIYAYATKCADYYYNLGFQVVFAIHWEDTYSKVREGYHAYCLMWYHRTLH